jgi:hypothetical protein
MAPFSYIPKRGFRAPKASRSANLTRRVLRVPLYKRKSRRYRRCLQVRSAPMLQPQHLTCLCSACCGHTPLHTPILAFGDPAQYLGHSNNEATQLQRSNNSAGVSFHASRRKTTTRYGDLRCTGSYEGVQNPPLPLLRILSTHSRRSRTRISGDDTATVTAPDRRERFRKK